jgi:glycosyltransferase involved in cell wall biosynthesis
MQIRAAYDIRVFSNEFGRHDYKSGIYRETEEILHEFGRRDDIDLTLVNLNDKETFIAGSVKAGLVYANSDSSLKSYKLVDSLGSRLNIRKLYDTVVIDRISEEFQKVPKFSPRSVFIRGVAKFLRDFDAYFIFDANDFDIYHSTYHKLPDVEITNNLPRVLTIQDLIPAVSPQFVGSVLRESFQEILASINYEKDWVICISEHTRQEFCEYTGMAPERTAVTPLAAADHFYPVNDPQRIANVRQRYNIPEGNYFLTLASHLAPHKNLDHLIHCFFQLLSEHPNLDINLVLAGSKRYKPGQTIESSEFSQFNSRVVYTGYIDDEDLSAVYSGATAFIFPSLYEGFGLPPLEAMKCGTPVICSNATSLPEVVGDAGILINPKDEDALCQAMLNVLKDSSLLQELHQKGLVRAQQFSWANCAENTVDFYKKVINW